MKSTLGKAVRKLFDSRMREELPMFTVTTSTWATRMGIRVYEHCPFPGLTFFILLFPSPKHDRFTIELAWGTKDKLPATCSFLSTDPPDEEGLRFRMPRLWVSRDK